MSSRRSRREKPIGQERSCLLYSPNEFIHPLYHNKMAMLSVPTRSVKLCVSQMIPQRTSKSRDDISTLGSIISFSTPPARISARFLKPTDAMCSLGCGEHKGLRSRCAKISVTREMPAVENYPGSGIRLRLAPDRLDATYGNCQRPQCERCKEAKP